jgi:hypothetical protein
MQTTSGEGQAARAELTRLSQLLLPFAIRGLATLGVADVLASGPLPVQAIAGTVGADTDALYRTMRFTASHGVFAELPDRVFELTPCAEFLRGDVPGSMRQGLMLGEGTASQLQIYSEIGHTLRTGESGYQKLTGTSPFQAMATNQTMARRIGGQMQDSARRLGENLADAVDFSGDQLIADVGGGTGTLIGTVLARYPHLSGVLLDLPPVVSGAPDVLESLGVASRCQVIGGDMFQEVPAGADSYVLSCVLHDWPDDRAAAVLSQVRAAMPDSGRLLIIEAVIGGDGTPTALAVQADFAMLMYGGGKERNASEHTTLLAQAGFELADITPTASGFSVLQARPAGRGAAGPVAAAVQRQ